MAAADAAAQAAAAAAAVNAIADRFALFFSGATPASCADVLAHNDALGLGVVDRGKLGALAVVAAGIKRTNVEADLLRPDNQAVQTFLQRHCYIQPSMGQAGHYNWAMLAMIGHMIVHSALPTHADTSRPVRSLRKRIKADMTAHSIFTDRAYVAANALGTNPPSQYDVWTGKIAGITIADANAAVGAFRTYFTGTTLTD